MSQALCPQRSCGPLHPLTAHPFRLSSAFTTPSRMVRQQFQALTFSAHLHPPRAPSVHLSDHSNHSLLVAGTGLACLLKVFPGPETVRRRETGEQGNQQHWGEAPSFRTAGKALKGWMDSHGAAQKWKWKSQEAMGLSLLVRRVQGPLLTDHGMQACPYTRTPSVQYQTGIQD